MLLWYEESVKVPETALDEAKPKLATNADIN